MEVLSFIENTGLIALLVAILPFFSFVFILFSNKRKGANFALSTSSLSFLLSLHLFLQIWNAEPEHFQLSWFQVAKVQFFAGVLLNNLSVLMMVLVSGISVLVHIYSREYMKNDPNLNRYWAYLSLFCFSMIGLVISDSLLLIYLFWELVGFSSYLLIGFWFNKNAASQAAKKAFIMNRIGDLGFLTGILIIYAQFQTLDLVSLFGDKGLLSSSSTENGLWISGSRHMPEIWLSIAGFSFFLGAMAKSAQFPLHTWLPDAMEGPTSISSLLHAATMVAAGVFLIARIYSVFDPLVLDIMVWIGAFTAFMATTIALTQNDIKRILAYSTISQLGFMVMALGIGAYSESIFHLTTHAFFKCLLFLAAGSVIHQLHHYSIKNSHGFDYQDIRFMGGLRKRMPFAFLGMCIASAALVGLPLTSGFLSKDSILIRTFEWAASREGVFVILPWIMVLTSWLTAFYIFRLVFKVFFSESREIKLDKLANINDSPGSMTYVLIILSFFCTFIVFALNPVSFESSWLWKGFQLSVIKEIRFFHWLVPLIINLGSILLIMFAYRIYVLDKSSKLTVGSWIYQISNRGWFFNEIYDFMFIKSVEKLAKIFYQFDRVVIDGLVIAIATITQLLSSISHWFDRKVVDGLVNATGVFSGYIGRFFRTFHSGRLQHYLITMLLFVLSFFILSYLI
jgi:NADH-quinone oxidoreductase subunit L